MKRFITILLVLALALSLSLGVSAANVTPAADPTTVAAGEEVTVTVSLDNSLSGITNFQYSLYFDSDLFEMTSAAVGTACPSAQITGLKSDSNGSFYGISFVDATSLGVDIQAGVIATLTFTAKSDVTADASAAFTLVKGSLMDTTWTQVDDGAVSDGTISVTVTPAAAPATPVAQVFGFTLTLKGEIGVNAYLCLTDEVVNNAEDYQVEFWDGETLASATKAGVAIQSPRTEEYEGKTYTVYPFSFTTVPKEMSTVFTMKIKQISADEYVSFANQSGVTVTYIEHTVNDYLDDRLQNSQSDEMKALAGAMMDYGAYAEHYFDVLNNDSTEPLPSIEGFTPITVSELPDTSVYTQPTGITGFTYVGSTLVLESETSFRLYFTSDNVDSLTISEKTKGELTIKEGQGKNEGRYYVQISNIAAKDLDSMYEFTISNGTESTTAVHGPFGYIRWALANGSENLKYLVSALYYYNQAANDYFD